MKKIFHIVIALFFVPSALNAAVLIESRDQSGELTRIYLQDQKARIETASQDGFMVLDLSKKQLKLIIHEHKAILDLSDIFSTRSQTYNSEGEFIDSYIESKGLGPRIAGYETEEYQIFSNDKYCGSAFVSVRAIQETGFRKFFTILSKLSDHIERKMAVKAFMPQPSACDQAATNVGNQLLNTGFPLRFTSQHKQLRNEVTNINTRAALPANAFLIPASYQPTTPAELLTKASKQLKHMQPEMMQMLEAIPPEARELMFKQLQQMQR